MATFKYKAKKGPSEIVEGNINADSQAEALNKLSAMGYFPISVSIQEGTVANSEKKGSNLSVNLFQRVTIRDISAFTRQLSDLIDSGVTLFRSVQILCEQDTNPLFKAVLEDVQNSIRDGKTLHESLSKHPKVFSPLYVNMVKSGEIGGMLETVLDRLADFAEKEDETKSKIKAAMAYPMVMAGVGILSVLGLMIFVIPRMVKLFDDMGQVLPIPTQILIVISHALSQYWWIFIIISIIGTFFFSKWKSTEEGGVTYDKFKLNIPVIKDLILKDEISRFGRTLSTLLTNGVPIIQSLNIIVETISNKVVKNDFKKITDDISKGAKLGECLKRVTYFPALFVNMVAVGEESGHMEKSLEKVALSYEKQVDRTIKTLTTLLEPLMIIVLGCILGAIVISMILPIFDISNVAH